MNRLTLRQIPDDVMDELRASAESTGQSLNKTAIALLRQAVGLDDAASRKRDISGIVGRWDSKDLREFEENTKMFESIDEELWEK